MLEDLQAPRAGFFRGRAGQDSPRCGVNSIHAPKTQRRLTNPPTQLCPHGIRMKRRTGEALPNPGHSVPWNRAVLCTNPIPKPPRDASRDLAGAWTEQLQFSPWQPSSSCTAHSCLASNPRSQADGFFKINLFFFFFGSGRHILSLSNPISSFQSHWHLQGSAVLLSSMENTKATALPDP